MGHLYILPSHQHLPYIPLRIDHKEIDFSDFNYRVPDKKGGVYSIKDRSKLLMYLRDIIEPYSLAIQLDFQLTARVAEIKGLEWEDVDFENNRIYIHRQALNERCMNDDLSFGNTEINVYNRTKCNTEKGKRYLPLTQEAREILKKAKEINPDGQYVFMPFGKLMLTDTFNEYLKKYCNAAGVPYYSSHKIRFSSCSLLYDGKTLHKYQHLWAIQILLQR